MSAMPPEADKPEPTRMTHTGLARRELPPSPGLRYSSPSCPGMSMDPPRMFWRDQLPDPLSAGSSTSPVSFSVLRLSRDLRLIHEHWEPIATYVVFPTGTFQR